MSNIEELKKEVEKYYKQELQKCKNKEEEKTYFLKLAKLLIKNNKFVLGIISPEGDIIGFTVKQACIALGYNPKDKLQYKDVQSKISGVLGKTIREFNIPFGSRKVGNIRYYGIIYFEDDQIEYNKECRARTKGHLKTLLLNERNKRIKEIGCDLQLLLDFKNSK